MSDELLESIPCPTCTMRPLMMTDDGWSCGACGTSGRFDFIPMSALDPESQRELLGNEEQS